MEEFATKFADKLEDTAKKIRSQTVDRADRFTNLAAAALVAAVLGLVTLIFLVVALFRTVEQLTSNPAAYLIFGGLFLALGWLLWRQRNQPQKRSQKETQEHV